MLRRPGVWPAVFGNNNLSTKFAGVIRGAGSLAKVVVTASKPITKAALAMI